MNNEELVKAIQNKSIDTTEGMKQLYTNNIGVIHKIVKKYAAYGEEDDLMQEAYFGLYKAVMRYDENMGVKFVTYAFKCISRSIMRYIENNENIIRFPSYRQNLIAKYSKLLEKTRVEYNREPSSEEVASDLHISPDRVEHLKKDLDRIGVKSLDEFVPGVDTEKIAVIDTVPADIDVESSVLCDILDKQFNDEFWNIIGEKLDECEQTVIEERYKNNMTHKEISCILTKSEGKEFTQGKSRWIEEKAIQRLRRSNLGDILNQRFEIAITKAYRGGIWSGNVRYTPTERAAFKDMGVRI